MVDYHIIQAQGGFHLKKKPGLLPITIQQVELPLRKQQRQGHTRQASARAHQEGYFSESMFVRFVPLWLQGRWQGRDHG